MSTAKATLYDPEWQALRVSLLKRNQTGAESGGFVTEEGTRANIKRLREYLGSSPSKDKLWRVLNLLNAVRMGNSGQKAANSDRDELIREYRDEVREKYTSAAGSFSPPTDQEVKTGLKKLSPMERKAVYTDLSRRWKLHPNKSTRRELRHFLDLMEETKT